MKKKFYAAQQIKIHPSDIALHIPPATWNGDKIGHIGEYDTFFYVLEGEMILSIENQYYMVKSGQMAFLPEGKMRKYTKSSSIFTMYEVRFKADISGKNLMSTLGMTDKNFVINVPDTDKMNKLFEKSYRKERNKDSLYDIIFSNNLLTIIKTYIEVSYKNRNSDLVHLDDVIKYMNDNYNEILTAKDLAKIAHMETTYFTRKFKKAFGIPPLTYFANIKYHRVCELLITTNDSMESISKTVGINDVSYFSRWFKKNSGLSPSEYRKNFHEY